MEDRTSDGQALRLLTVMDEYTRECLATDVGRRLNSEHVLERLTELFILRGVPEYLRSDNGSEFTAKQVRDWLRWVGVKTAPLTSCPAPSCAIRSVVLSALG